ncbi:MAG: thiamine-phosphate kinase [Thermoanaerobaculia bacterium]|nr:thiamine-phosphate kinase [Thermoanaerobaculia bacterium]
MTEERLISWLNSRPGTSALVDDCAFLDLGEPWAVTVDTQTEGIHIPEGLDEEVLARRLLAVNLSDLAAVGAQPAHAFLTLAAPPDFDHRRFFEGFLYDAIAVGLTLSGGDVSRGDRYTATLTLLGRRADGAERFMPRSNARPGDRLWLGGPVGRSHLGFLLGQLGARLDDSGVLSLPRHLPPELLAAAERAVRCHVEPLKHVKEQLGLGVDLVRLPRSAGLDVSDGLAKDLHRLCAESGVGAVIEAEAISLPEDDRALAEFLDADPLEAALGGGEDYVLLFALPADVEAPGMEAPGVEAPGVEAPGPGSGGCREIGRVTTGIVELNRCGRLRALPATGFDHLAR